MVYWRARGGSMNRYLTEKAEKKPWWHLPIAGFSILMTAVSIEVWIEDKDLEDIVIFLLAHLFVTGIMALPLVFIIRHALRRRLAQQLAQKLAALHGQSVPLEGLDKRLGVKNAAKKIEKLTAAGFLKLASVDEEAGCLWLNDPYAVAVEAPAADDGDEFGETIRRIRKLNDDIADEAVSERIDRIEAVTASIFRTIEEQPDHAEAARRFMNYYLPTTLRLLETYRLMEGQSYQGENIQVSRKRIEEVLDKLVHATEQQQDKLFSSDAIDVETEIRVLETMMASDGTPQGGV